MKTCTKCGSQKPLEDFYKHPTATGGYQSKCKECAKQDTRLNYTAKKSRYQAYGKQPRQHPEFKTCVTCGIQKPITGFKADWQMADGYLNQCKECVNQHTRSWYAANNAQRLAYAKQQRSLEKYRAYRRLHSKTPGYKALQAKFAAIYRAKDPQRFKARKAVNNAVRDGKLQRLPCLYCGASKTEAHHPDYTKPLDVQWLCMPCHKQHHLTLKEKTK